MNICTRATSPAHLYTSTYEVEKQQKKSDDISLDFLFTTKLFLVSQFYTKNHICLLLIKVPPKQKYR